MRLDFLCVKEGYVVIGELVESSEDVFIIGRGSDIFHALPPCNTHKKIRGHCLASLTASVLVLLAVLLARLSTTLNISLADHRCFVLLTCRAGSCGPLCSYIIVEIQLLGEINGDSGDLRLVLVELFKLQPLH